MHKNVFKKQGIFFLSGKYNFLFTNLFRSPWFITKLFPSPMAVRLKPLLPLSVVPHNSNPSNLFFPFSKKSHFQASAAKMAENEVQSKASSNAKIIDSHLHVWASADEVKPHTQYCINHL